MKSKVKYAIIIIVLWIPLSVVLYIHSQDESLFQRILISIASGPIMFFYSGIGALALSALIGIFFFVSNKLEDPENQEKDGGWKAAKYAFPGSFCIIFIALYYFTITNQHVFWRIYGGW